jgi:aryl-alcohol dehydrogenase-like predicted oxidoreductase
MKYAHLGRSGLLVSRVALGTMNFGDATGEDTAFEIMDLAAGQGVNFFDSATSTAARGPRTWNRATAPRKSSPAGG